MQYRSPWPQTINGAAERIIAIMNDEEKKKVKDIQEGEMAKLRFTLELFIVNELGLHEGNEALMKACALSKYGDFESVFFLDDADAASDVISEEVWNRLNSVRHDTPL